MDPLILRKLQAFALRRRRLIIARGICAALAALLLTMIAVALLDRLFLLPDWARWTLSGLAYAAVCVTEWRACLRLLLRAPGPKRLARLVEQAAPSLREDLLSAVELGEGDASLDSPLFRQLLQNDVSKRMAGMEAEDLLPTQMLQSSFCWLGGAVAVLAVVFLTSGLNFGQMLLRALLPGANLERISSIQIEILDPAPAEKPAPQGDTVPLLAHMIGGQVEKAYLETFTKSGNRNLVPMSVVGDGTSGRFAASVQVAREDVAYRVRTRTAISRKYTLHAAARPQVTVFQKTFRYPDYTQLPEKKVAEPSGDIVALEGTEVELRLQTDQPVQEAELRLETAKITTVVPLEPAPDGGLRARMPLVSSGTYHVHLVATETGFENKFSPEYEWRAVPDLIPRVEIETPPQDLIAANNQTIEIAGTASDDLLVSSVEQVYRVNEKSWKTIQLPITPSARLSVRNFWDLSREHLRAGDQVTAKFVAMDQKGSKGESRPVRITIVESGFDPRRADDLAEHLKLLEECKGLRGVSEALTKLGDEARKAAEQTPMDEKGLALAWTAFGEGLNAYEEHADAVEAQLLKTLPKSEAGSEAGTLVMLGRRLGRYDGDGGYLRALQRAVADPASAPQGRDLVREASEQTRKIEAYSRRLEDSCRWEVGTIEMGIVAENLQVLWRDQHALNELARITRSEDTSAWFRIAAQYKIILAEATQVEDALQEVGQRLRGDLAGRAQKSGRRLRSQRVELLKTVSVEKPNSALQGQSANYANVVSEVMSETFSIMRGSIGISTRSYLELRQEVQPSWALFERLRVGNELILHNEKLPAALRLAQAEAAWDERVSVWKKYGDWEEVRPDADQYWVQSLRALALALLPIRDQVVSLAAKPERETAYQQLVALTRSFRALETVHDLSELASGLDSLAAQERWEAASLRARTSGPTNWAWLENRLRGSVDEINRLEANTPELRLAVTEAQSLLRRAHDDGNGRGVEGEMQQRLNQERRPLAQERSVRVIASLVREAIKLLQPAREEAEKTLAAAAPKLSEKLAQLARKAAELQKQSKEKAASAETTSADLAKNEVRQEQTAQQKLNQEVEAVKDSLRNDAQRQNLLDQEGQERARDADDAVAMLREPPPRAEQALNDAASGEKAVERQDALKNAANEQEKLAATLEKLSEHYDNLEKGKGDETRVALREEEKKMGLTEQLDKQFAQTALLAQTAQGTPEEMLKKLEQALPQNALMRQELSDVAKEAIKTAAEKLAAASAQENKIAETVNRLATEQAKQAEQAAGTEAARQAEAEQQESARPGEAAQQRAAEAAKQQAAADAAKSAPSKTEGREGKPPASGDKPEGEQNPAAEKPASGEKGMASQDNPTGQQGEKPPGANPSKPPTSTQTAAGQTPPAAQTSPTAQNAAGAKPNPPPGQAPAGATPPNPTLAQASTQQPAIAQAATEAGQEVERAGRHEERLNQPLGDQLQRLGRELQATGANEVPQAKQALDKALVAKQAQAPVANASAKLQRDLRRLGEAAPGAPEDSATDPAASATPPAGNPPAPGGTAMAPQPGEAKTPSSTPGAPEGTPPSGAQAQNTPPTAGRNDGPPPQPPSSQDPAAPKTASNAAGNPAGPSPNGKPAGAPGAPSPGGQPPAGAPPSGSQAAMAAAGSPPPGSPAAGAPPGSQSPAGRAPAAGESPGNSLPFPAPGSAATPEQQVWMARALDALDAALHAQNDPHAPSPPDSSDAPPQAGQPSAGQSPPGQPGQSGPPSSQASSQALSEAQQAMNAAAQAAAASMNAARGEAASQQRQAVSKGGEQAASKTGAQASADGQGYGAIPAAGGAGARTTDWGKLPKKMAEQLSQGQREGTSSEYKNQVETYYRVIAERARKK